MSKSYIVDILLNARDGASGVMQSAAANTQGAFQRIGAFANDNERAFGRLGDQATIAGGAMVGAMALAARESAQFSNGLAEIATLSDDAASSIEQYRGSVLRMAGEYGQSTDALTKSIYDSISAGVEAGKADEFVAKSSKLATVGRIEASQSVNLLTSTLNSYGAKVEETDRYSDAMFATVQQGKVTLGQLANVMGQVAPTAALANVKIEELGAAMATTTSAGLSAEMSATGLKSVLIATLAPSDSLAAALRKHGYASGEAALKAEGLAGVMKIVAEESGGSATKMQELYPSVEAFSAVSILASNNAGTLTTKLEAVRGATGATAAEFSRMADEPAFKMKQAQESFKASTIAMGQSTMTMLAPLAEATAAVSGFMVEHQTLASVIGGSVLVIGGLVGVIGVSIKAVQFAKAAQETWNTVKELGTLISRRQAVAELEVAAASRVSGAAQATAAASARGGMISLGSAARSTSVQLAGVAVSAFLAVDAIKWLYAGIAENEAMAKGATDQAHEANVLTSQAAAKRKFRAETGRNATLEDLWRMEQESGGRMHLLTEGQREKVRQQQSLSASMASFGTQSLGTQSFEPAAAQSAGGYAGGAVQYVQVAPSGPSEVRDPEAAGILAQIRDLLAQRSVSSQVAYAGSEVY